MEIDEAPPAADKASRFRGSGTIGAPEGRGNRNAATVTVLRDELSLFAAGRRQKLRRCANAHVVRKNDQSYLPPGGGKVCDADCALRVHLAAPIGAADRKGAAVCMQSK